MKLKVCGVNDAAFAVEPSGGGIDEAGIDLGGRIGRPVALGMGLPLVLAQNDCNARERVLLLQRGGDGRRLADGGVAGQPLQFAVEPTGLGRTAPGGLQQRLGHLLAHRVVGQQRVAPQHLHRLGQCRAERQSGRHEKAPIARPGAVDPEIAGDKAEAGEQPFGIIVKRRRNLAGRAQGAVFPAPGQRRREQSAAAPHVVVHGRIFGNRHVIGIKRDHRIFRRLGERVAPPMVHAEGGEHFAHPVVPDHAHRHVGRITAMRQPGDGIGKHRRRIAQEVRRTDERRMPASHHPPVARERRRHDRMACAVVVAASHHTKGAVVEADQRTRQAVAVNRRHAGGQCRASGFDIASGGHGAENSAGDQGQSQSQLSHACLLLLLFIFTAVPADSPSHRF